MSNKPLKTPKNAEAQPKVLPTQVKKQINQGLPGGRYELIDGSLVKKETR